MLKLSKIPNLKLIAVTVALLCVNITFILLLGKILDSQNSFESQKFQVPLIPLRANSSLSSFRKLFTLDFHFLILNDCVVHFIPKIILIVTSYAAHIELRSAIRRSYSEEILRKLGIRRVFLLAKLKNHEISENALKHENSRYKDLIQGDFLEDYKNLTYKHIMGLKWAVTYCKNVKYIIKMDDDIVVNFFELSKFLDDYQGDIALMGYLLSHMKVIRRKANKWFVDVIEYYDDEFPPFLSGWLYISTPYVVEKLLSFTHRVRYFWIDDVYVTGLLAEQAGVKHQMINNKYTSDHRFLKCCFKYDFICDILVGPNGGENNLQVEFFKHIEKCYKMKCPSAPKNFSVQNNCVLPFQPKVLSGGKASIDLIS